MKQYKLLEGDAKDVLNQFEDNTFHCCITSPPYWQQRDYFVNGQLGNEETPDEYISKLVEVFNEVKRVLRKDGILWIVIGDTYKKSGMKINIRNKNIIGIPWKLAFALQENDWIIRTEVINNKTNVIPDGARDRPTHSHDYIFMCTKSPKYFYDYYSSLEDSESQIDTIQRFGAKNQKGTFRHDQERTFEHYGKRNRRSVWTTSVANFKGSHFAVFNPELIEPALKASISTKGYCPQCKSPWKRILEKVKTPANNAKGYNLELITREWQPTCKCGIEEKEVGLILDPFCGTSTTGLVAFKYNMDYVGIDINKDYLEISKSRLKEDDIFVNIGDTYND